MRARLLAPVGLTAIALLAVAACAPTKKAPPVPHGSETFECNTMAYVVMAVGLIGLTGLASMLGWTVIDWFLVRRSRARR